MTTTTAPATYTIPASHLPEVAAKVDAFNALAARNGLAARVSTSYTLRTEVRSDDFGLKFEVVLADVVIEGERLVLDGGYTVAASLDHVSADGNVVRLAPAFREAGVPEEFRTSAATRCDHCGVRRDRNRSIVVHSETEGFKVVGATCVKVFLGVSPESVVALLSALDSLRDECKEGGRGRRVVTPGEYVAAAALVTSVYGFVPRSAEHSIPTASIVETLLVGGSALSKNFPEIARPSEAEVAKASALAAAAIEWVRSNTESSDFIWNLRTAVNAHEVGRSGGLLACLPNAFKRATEVAAKAAAKGERKPSEFIGSVNEKITFKGSVVYTNRSEPYSYGGPEGLFAIVLTEAGDTVYFNTTVATAIGRTLEDAEKDAVLGFAATVKAHKVNSKGEKVTAVTRAKVLG